MQILMPAPFFLIPLMVPSTFKVPRVLSSRSSTAPPPPPADHPVVLHGCSGPSVIPWPWWTGPAQGLEVVLDETKCVQSGSMAVDQRVLGDCKLAPGLSVTTVMR